MNKIPNQSLSWEEIQEMLQENYLKPISLQKHITKEHVSLEINFHIGFPYAEDQIRYITKQIYLMLKGCLEDDFTRYFGLDLSHAPNGTVKVTYRRAKEITFKISTTYNIELLDIQ